MLKEDIQNKNKVISTYEIMIEKGSDAESLAYACVHCTEKFMSLHLLRQHHHQFHKKQLFDESIYVNNIFHKNAKERKELEHRMFEEQKKREAAKEKEIKQLQKDLDILRKELSGLMKTEVAGVIREKDEDMKVMDSHIDEMRKMIQTTLASKDDHRDWYQKHEQAQGAQFVELQTKIDTVLVRYKNDLENNMDKLNRDQLKAKGMSMKFLFINFTCRNSQKRGFR